MESQLERLARYLDDALAVERSLASSLEDMAGDVDDRALKALFEDHRRVTQQQASNLEARIRALGQEPSSTKGFLSQAAAKVGDMLHAPKDDLDKPTQYLVKAFAAENLELAMYRALEVYAEAVGDQDTVRLARQHSQQEKETADRIWPLIAQTARRPAEVAGAAR